MGVHILVDADNEHGVLYDSVTGNAFGKVHTSSNGGCVEEMQLFLDWLPLDARHYTEAELLQRYCNFRAVLLWCDRHGVPYVSENEDGTPSDGCPDCDAEFGGYDDEPADQFLTDAEADADVLASAGMGTDEDYGCAMLDVDLLYSGSE